MNQREAMKDTVNRINIALQDELLDQQDTDLLNHINGMPERMEDWFSEAKLGRWLGWVQGVACAKEWLTLDECKNINKSYSDGTVSTV